MWQRLIAALYRTAWMQAPPPLDANTAALVVLLTHLHLDAHSKRGYHERHERDDRKYADGTRIFTARSLLKNGEYAAERSAVEHEEQPSPDKRQHDKPRDADDVP